MEKLTQKNIYQLQTGAIYQYGHYYIDYISIMCTQKGNFLKNKITGEKIKGSRNIIKYMEAHEYLIKL